MPPEPLRYFVGYDARERNAYMACVASFARLSSREVRITALDEQFLRARGLYWRPYRTAPAPDEDADHRMSIDATDGPFSTAFSYTRFLVPALADFKGWALYSDCDFLWRADPAQLVALADDRFAVMVVKHDHRPPESVKMDGQLQRPYPRKNWSSLILWNCEHPSNLAFHCVRAVNASPRLDLHTFSWLRDEEIGALPDSWNWLEGWSDPAIDPAAVHFTRGIPSMPGFHDVAYAEEWRRAIGP